MAGYHHLYIYLLPLFVTTLPSYHGPYKETGPASASIPVHAPPMTTTMKNATKMQETHLGYKKVYLPIPFEGTEMDVDCALVYYTASAKINDEGHNMPYRTCLAEILCLSSIS